MAKEKETNKDVDPYADLSKEDRKSLARDLLCKQCPQKECDYEDGECTALNDVWIDRDLQEQELINKPYAVFDGECRSN